jgi:hypothetical protein
MKKKKKKLFKKKKALKKIKKELKKKKKWLSHHMASLWVAEPPPWFLEVVRLLPKSKMGGGRNHLQKPWGGLDTLDQSVWGWPNHPISHEPPPRAKS